MRTNFFLFAAPGGGDAVLRRGDGGILLRGVVALLSSYCGRTCGAPFHVPDPLVGLPVAKSSRSGLWRICGISDVCGRDIHALDLPISADHASRGSSRSVPSFNGVVESSNFGSLSRNEQAELTRRALLDKLRKW